MTFEQCIRSITSKITAHEGKEPLIIAIDGKSASGKSTFAARLADELGVQVIATDDFYRPRNNSGELDISLYDGNFDIERFSREVVSNLNGDGFEYGVFDCRSGSIKETKSIAPYNAIVIEGAYSVDPKLGDYAGIKIFFDISAEEQIKRIEKRNGREGVKRFTEIWIPAEERYFSYYGIKKSCDLLVNNDAEEM